MPFLNRSINFLYRNFWAVCFYDFVLGVVGYFWISPNGSIDFFFNLVPQSVLGAFLVATILMLVRGLILRFNKRWAKLLAGAITTSVITIATIEIWILFILRTRLTDRILRLVLDSNPREAGGFLSEYFFNLPSLGVLLGFLLVSSVAYHLFRHGWLHFTRFLNLLPKPWSMAFKILLTVATLFGCYTSYRFDAVSLNRDNSLSRLVTTIRIQHQLNHNIRLLEKSIPLADGKLRKNYLPPARIIWVIGESDNKSHSQAYGYSIPTTPTLVAEQQAGNLLCFSDVVGYAPWTIEMMDILFSPADVDAPADERFSVPLLPMLFRSAGYKVRMFDNQTTLVRAIAGADLGAESMMNSRLLSEANFNYRNERMEFFDSDMLRNEWNILAHSDAPTLDIIHLLGSHLPFNERCPNDLKVFSADLYSSRSDLSATERAGIADYDNAVRYVDSELKSLFDLIRDEDAILIYIPDHGELIHDLDHRSGRRYAMDPNPDPKVVAHYLELPMYVFTSPRFRSLRPDLFARLQKAQHRPFSTSRFSHFLLDLAGIDSKYLRPELSPLSERWSNRRRAIWCAEDYDAWQSKTVH